VLPNIFRTKTAEGTVSDMTKKTDSPHVVIVILNWNNPKDTLECIESVYGIDYPGAEVVVVDNNSSDNSVELVSKQYPELHIIRNHENTGYAGGNNVGIHYAIEHDADYVFVLNNDCTVEPGCLKKLVTAASNNPDYGAVCPAVVNYYKPEEIVLSGQKINWFSGKISYRQIPVSDIQQEIIEPDALSGTAILLPVNVIKQVGMFDKEYFLFYEDMDLSIRIKNAGYKLAVVTSAKIFHKESRSTGPTHAPLALYYGTRNRLLFMKKRAPFLPKLFFTWLYFPVSFLTQPVRVRFNPEQRNAIARGVKDYYKKEFYKRKDT
jgi:GT2 family glycosyltransferase